MLWGSVPGMGFTAEAFWLRREMQWQYGETQPLDGVTPGEGAFGRVRLESRDDVERSLQFAVESQTGGYQQCRGQGNCHDIRFGVTNGDDAGRLYLYAPAVDAAGRGELIAYDFEQQAAEISAKDPDTGLAVYHEVRIEPPVGSPADCGDFPDQDKLRYVCLFMHEILPEVLPVTTSQMTRALPDLTQAGSDYSLVFAEEFNGGGPRSAFPCESGVAALDSSIWYISTTCRPDGESCADMGDGHLTISQYGGCGVEVQSDSGFAFKYGYFEVKYTVNPRTILAWNNYNLLIGNAGEPRRHIYPRYGIEIDSYEGVSKYVGAIIGAFEYAPNGGYQIMQSHINHNYLGSNPDMQYRRTVRETRLCNTTTSSQLKLRPIGPKKCGRSDHLTLVLGMEWTPRGNRHFVKVTGMHDELITVQPRYEFVGNRDRSGDWRWYRGDSAASFLEYLVPDDDESYLVNYAVSHAAMPLHIGAWGYNYLDSLTAWLKIDYIRVFQPDNLYRDMEPVYE